MDAQEQAPGLIRGEGLTAWRQIADALTADIAAGRYAPGQQ
ncbi:phosphonate metabolism transcriptional regulator PhnF, partial [Methylobacterium sp. WL18]